MSRQIRVADSRQLITSDGSKFQNQTQTDSIFQRWWLSPIRQRIRSTSLECLSTSVFTCLPYLTEMWIPLASNPARYSLRPAVTMVTISSELLATVHEAFQYLNLAVATVYRLQGRRRLWQLDNSPSIWKQLLCFATDTVHDCIRHTFCYKVTRT